jgi:hypothetical protein
MKQFHIGLDFGTYQSKACIYDVENDTHEFFHFPNGTFFLPSRVAKKTNGKFEYGDATSETVFEEYCYFKIAAAEDEEFQAETYGTNGSDNFYQYNEFKNYTSEFLAVAYLTYLIFTIKDKYQQPIQRQVNTGGLLSRIFQRRAEQDEVRFTVQLGIPTEWSQKKNLRRKRKFENILMLSEMLQKKYKDKETFLAVTSEQLLTDVKYIYKSYNFSDKEAFEVYLNELGISVYPETAAGLTFIVKTKQLLPGYYAIMDIGGGSTDISFFRIQEEGNIRYLASESYMMAANNVYRKYFGETPTLLRLQKAELEVRKLITSDNWEENDSIVSALNDVNDELCKIVYKLFNKRVYWFNKKMIKNYTDQPIILYGGGIRLPIINNGKILINDHGNKTSITISLTHIEKQEMKKYASIINIRPTDRSWESDFPLLAVALGLSFIKPTNSADWFNDSDYKVKDGDQRAEFPHPFNEGYYIYDVINSKWK